MHPSRQLRTRHLSVPLATRPRTLWSIGWLIVAAALAVPLACGDATRSTQPDGTLPDRSETAMSPDRVYSGSASASDSVWFSFAADRGKSFVAILEVDSGSAVVAILGSASGQVLQTMERRAGGEETPGYYSSDPIRSSDPHIYYITVTGPASFHLSIHQATDLPEVAPFILPVGDTIIGESIDDLVPHDTDTFRLMGAPGGEYNIFLRVSHGDESRMVRLETVDGIANEIIQGDGRDTSLTEHATGIFRMPATGTLNIRVAGVADEFGNTSTGEYMLYVYRIDRHPENSADQLVLSDSVITESIDFASDIDEYTFVVAEPMWVNLAFTCESGGAPLWATLVGPGGGVGGVYDCNSQLQLLPTTGDMPLAPGSYTIRVSAPNTNEARHTGGYTGRYNLYGYRIDGAPENANVIIAVGDTIEGESLDPPGDFDNFILQGHRGDDIDILVYGLDEGWQQYLELHLGYSSGRTEPLGMAYWLADGDERRGTDHLVLAEDGDYPLSISGRDFRRDGGGASPYRVVVQRVSRAVEHHSAAISVGDVVADERLDDWNDLDEFTVTGEPGQSVAASVSADPSTMGVRLEAVDPTTRETLAYTTSNPTRPTGVTEPFALDASGTAAIRIYRATDVVPGEVGAYAFDVHGFSAAPENTSAAIAIGDTVRGEWVDPLGDVDEYTFDGGAGDRLVVYFNPVSSPDPEWPLTLEVFEKESDQILGSIQIGAVGAELGDWHTEAFVLPEPGRYVVRVRGYDKELGSGQYAFTVQRAP
jgi:hypothetical protein